MRLFLFSCALLGLAFGKPGIYQVPPELIDNFISEFHLHSTEELLKSFDYLPGSPDETDLVILKEVYNGLRNESDTELLTDVFLKIMQLSIQQKTVSEVETELEDHFSNLTATQFNETKGAIHNVFRNTLFKLFENEEDIETLFVDATTFMNRLFKASPAKSVEGEILGKIFEILSKNENNVEESLRDLLCTKTKEFACEDATDCAVSLVSSSGKSVDCVIPAIVTSNFNQQVISRVPPIASHSAKLNNLLNMLIVYRSSLEKAMVTQDNNIKAHIRNFFEENFSKVVESVIKESSFDSALIDIPKPEISDCQINGTDVVVCYAKMHARTIFEKELADIMKDAPAFEELTNTLYEGNLTDVEKLPIVLKNVEKMYKEANMEHHRDWKETFEQIEKLRESQNNETTDCDLKRHIRKIYFLLNFVNTQVISSQFKDDHLICLGPVVPIVCNGTLGNVTAIINDDENSAEEKIQAIEALWESTDTPHYSAMVNIVYARDLIVSRYVGGDLTSYIKNYIMSMADVLSKSCRNERRYENGTDLSVLNEDQFPQDSWNHSLHEIYKIEELVKDRIFLASNESEPLHKIFKIAENTEVKPSKRIDEIVGRIFATYGPADFDNEVSNYTLYLVLVNDFYNEIGHAFSEETAESALKHLEIVLAGNYRREYGVPIDYERFGKVFDFITDRQKRKEQLEAVIPCLDRNLFGIGITEDILVETREFVARFNSKQVETILQSTQRVDPKCKYISTTFEPRYRTNCTESTTESGTTIETSTGYTNDWTTSGGRKGTGTTSDWSSGTSTTERIDGTSGSGGRTPYQTTGNPYTSPDWTTGYKTTDDVTYYTTTDNGQSTSDTSDGWTSSRTSSDYDTTPGWRATGRPDRKITTDDWTYYTTTDSSISPDARYTATTDGRTSWTTSNDYHTTTDRGSTGYPDDRSSPAWIEETTTADWDDYYTSTSSPQATGPSTGFWRTSTKDSFGNTTDGSWSVRSTPEDQGFKSSTPPYGQQFWTTDPWKITTNPAPGASFGPNQCLCADSLQIVLDKMNFCNAKPDIRVIEIKWPENQRQKRSTGQQTMVVTQALAHEIFGVKKRFFNEEN